MLWLAITGGVLLVGGGFLLYRSMRAQNRDNYESAPYTVIEKQDNFEIREYPTMRVVQTNRNDNNGSFMKLFRFITGKNERKQQIAMTTPVFMTHEDQEKMVFVMPASMKIEDVPRPLDGAVEVKEMEGGHFAVYTYSGRMSRANEQTALEELRKWISGKPESGSVTGEPVYAYFDGPITPWFWKRNEVMLRLARRH